MANFWNNPSLEPKRQYKFLLEFGKGNIEKFLVKRADKPKFTVNAVQHDFLNHRFFYPGKLVWDPITITVVDVATTASSKGNATLAIMEAIGRTGYELPTGINSTKTLSKENSTKEGFGIITLSTINSEGAIMDNWRLMNPFITAVEFGSLDYSVEELVEVTLTIQYDYAILNSGSGKDEKMPKRP